MLPGAQSNCRAVKVICGPGDVSALTVHDPLARIHNFEMSTVAEVLKWAMLCPSLQQHDEQQAQPHCDR